MTFCKNFIVLRNVAFVRKLHLQRRVLNSEMVNRNILITYVTPKNESLIPIVLKSSMIMLSPEQSFPDLLSNQFHKKLIGDLFEKCNDIRKKAIYNGIPLSLTCMNEIPMQQPFAAESLDEPSKDQPDDLGRGLGESSDWEDEEEYDDEEDDQ